MLLFVAKEFSSILCMSRAELLIFSHSKLFNIYFSIILINFLLYFFLKIENILEVGRGKCYWNKLIKVLKLAVSLIEKIV